ncbi:hypothetical protein SAMN02745975_00947 [Geosporobacter subterraneus DSM 17957]|uniref:Uncharacterized protein n=1 Tax=Geosporobacter subterraneus DSM 17957 TaxID=1121919 RepID=A0A1M6F8L0_9FIRM|nr:hypothetical protein [Geosporobacter subterraneus]SHI94015.1 hypothetical protein SAMN02745975_00947 [Geosporobacter subterraneus DSM 17957]
MKNLHYCMDCRRIAAFNGECSYCQSTNFKDLVKKAPVNVIGTKIKGRVMNVKDQMVELVCVDQGNIKSLKQFEAEKLRKIL